MAKAKRVTGGSETSLKKKVTKFKKSRRVGAANKTSTNKVKKNNVNGEKLPKKKAFLLEKAMTILKEKEAMGRCLTPRRDNSQKVEVDKEKLKKYYRGDPIDESMIKVKPDQKKLSNKEEKVTFALEQSVRTELLLTEESGYIEADNDEETFELTQDYIRDAVDPNSAAKRFDLSLTDFGPYRMNYSRNGRFLLLGGRKGHVAAMDWISKKLMCEINVMESVHDVQWLHQETLYSVAQKKWVYFYDNKGIEIHCVKQLNDVVKLLFLPYHFLLSTVSSSGRLSWLDVTIGKIVEQVHIPVHHNPATAVVHPGNAFVCLGHSSGVVTFWSPNHKKACITKWCHKRPICSVAFDPKGQTFVTASVDRTVKLWDARNLNGPLQKYKLRSAPNWISLSQKNFMGIGMGNVVEIYKDTAVKGEMQRKLYLRHVPPAPVKNMEFCPHEDILGIAHSSGFSSILVPGSAEANFDALELNPFQTKAQRKEAEIQQLLTKIPAELITWDPTELRKVHVPSLEEIIEEKKKLDFIKPADVHIEPRYKTGKKSGSANAIKRKKIMKEEIRRNHVKMVMSIKEDSESSVPQTQEVTRKKGKNKSTVLDRFKPKMNR